MIVKKKVKIYEKAILNFIRHFDYAPNHPNEIDFDVMEYANLLKKCIEDDKDYTIELYGTIPQKSGEWPEILID